MARLRRCDVDWETRCPGPGGGFSFRPLRHSYQFLYIPSMTIKPAEFLGDTIEALRTFPEHTRQDAGFQLDKVQ